ncbi:MAG: mercuric transporter MerT family protein [Alphaproteobacteria bacterium]
MNATAKPVSSVANDSRAGGFLAAGGILGAVASTSCCILPLALFSAGVGGVWIGNLTALAPYQWVFIALTLAFLAGGFYLVYREPKVVCVGEQTCGSPRSRRIVKMALWSSIVLVAAAIAFPYVAPTLLGI